MKVRDMRETDRLERYEREWKRQKTYARREKVIERVNFFSEQS